MEFYSHIDPYLKEIEQIMLSDLEKEDERTYGMLVPFLKRGGKRIRPALFLLSCGAVGGNYKDALQPAAILELFHNFTLIHDDIEDDSKFRRGEPTLHISHGLPIALNSGDALYTLLWKKLVTMDMDLKKRAELQKLYANSFKRVVDGQGIELSWIKTSKFDVSEAEYLEMIQGKTSALMGLACEMGSFMGKSEEHRKSLRAYGEKIGTAFQIQDDVLNVSGDFEKYKKEIGGDITEGKRTLMVVHCLAKADDNEKKRLTSILASHSSKQEDISEAIELLKKTGSIEYAKQYSTSLVSQAKDQIKDLPTSKDKDALLSIADYVISREK